MMVQILIAITTVPAVFLSQSKSEQLRKWACIVGLAGEPFWAWSSWETGSWGIFATAIAVTIGWAVGLKNYWFPIRPEANAPEQHQPLPKGRVAMINHTFDSRPARSPVPLTQIRACPPGETSPNRGANKF